MVLWDMILPSSQIADFLNKVTIPCPNDWSPNLLVCHVMSNMSLDSVTVSFLFWTTLLTKPNWK